MRAGDGSLPPRGDHLINLAFWTLFGAVAGTILLSNDYELAGYRRAVPEAIYWFFQAYLWAALTPLIFWLVWRTSVSRSRSHLVLRGSPGSERPKRSFTSARTQTR